MPYVFNAQRNQSASPARSSYEFNFESSWFIEFNDCSQVPLAKVVLWQVTEQNNSVQYLKLHVYSPG